MKHRFTLLTLNITESIASTFIQSKALRHVVSCCWEDHYFNIFIRCRMSRNCTINVCGLKSSMLLIIYAQTNVRADQKCINISNYFYKHEQNIIVFIWLWDPVFEHLLCGHSHCTWISCFTIFMILLCNESRCVVFFRFHSWPRCCHCIILKKSLKGYVKLKHIVVSDILLFIEYLY